MYNFRHFLMLSMALSVGCAVALADYNGNENENYESSTPVRRLHKTPATIVVDATDSTTNYLEEPKKLSKKELKRLKEEKERQAKNEDLYRRSCLAAGRPYFTPEERAAKKAREKARLDSLLSIEYTVPEDNYTAKPMVWIDDSISESVDQLRPFFNISSSQVVPVGVNTGNESNDIFFYFDMVNDKPTNLHLCAKYFADDPLSIQSVRFLVNGFYYDLPLENTVQSGKIGTRFYWESVDENLSSDDKDLVYALSHADWARVIFQGKDCNHVKTFKKEQIQEFYRGLELYRQLGGRF